MKTNKNEKKSKIEALVGLASLGASLLGLQMGSFSLCLHVVIPLCAYPWCFHVCPDFLSF